MGYYYTWDHLGSVREMVDGSGNIVARYGYDPYGKTTLVSGSNLATFQYAGYYAHQASGLYLTDYRAYDANTGRWLSRDPIGERGGVGLYGYCSDDPEDNTDPSGLLARVPFRIPPPVIPYPEPFLLPALVEAGLQLDAYLLLQDADAVAQLIDANKAAADAKKAADEAVERQKAHDTYKARCNQSPPPGLDKCAEARWKR